MTVPVARCSIVPLKVTYIAQVFPKRRDSRILSMIYMHRDVDAYMVRPTHEIWDSKKLSDMSLHYNFDRGTIVGDFRFNCH